MWFEARGTALMSVIIRLNNFESSLLFNTYPLLFNLENIFSNIICFISRNFYSEVLLEKILCYEILNYSETGLISTLSVNIQILLMFSVGFRVQKKCNSKFHILLKLCGHLVRNEIKEGKTGKFVIVSLQFFSPTIVHPLNQITGQFLFW